MCRQPIFPLNAKRLPVRNPRNLQAELKLLTNQTRTNPNGSLEDLKAAFTLFYWDFMRQRKKKASSDNK